MAKGIFNIANIGFYSGVYFAIVFHIMAVKLLIVLCRDCIRWLFI